MNKKKYEECLKPALDWLNKNAPDFVVESVEDSLNLLNNHIETQQKYVETLEEIRSTQYLIIEQLELQLKDNETEDWKK